MATVVFDFDGTIADTLPLIEGMFNQYSGRQPLTEKEIDTLREMTAKEVIKFLKIPLWRVPSILVQGRKELAKHVEELHIFNGLAPVIRQLHIEGHELFVVSSNSTEVIRTFLKSNDLIDCFKAIKGNAGLFGKGAVIKKMLRKHSSSQGLVFCVGDEVRDIEMAKKLNYKSIAVSWGLNGPNILKSYKPDYFISLPTELVEIIK